MREDAIKYQKQDEQNRALVKSKEKLKKKLLTLDEALEKSYGDYLTRRAQIRAATFPKEKPDMNALVTLPNGQKITLGEHEKVRRI